jgi:hypothetical protein
MEVPEGSNLAIGSEGDRERIKSRMLTHLCCYTSKPFVFGYGYRSKVERDMAIRMMFGLKLLELAKGDLRLDRMQRTANDFDVFAHAACYGCE